MRGSASTVQYTPHSIADVPVSDSLTKPPLADGPMSDSLSTHLAAPQPEVPMLPPSLSTPQTPLLPSQPLPAQPVLRRSQRQRKKPAALEDYVQS